MGEAHKNKVRQRHIFKLNFYVMLVNFAKHRNKQCAAQQNMPRVQMYEFFFSAPENFRNHRATLPTSQILPLIRTRLRLVLNRAKKG